MLRGQTKTTSKSKKFIIEEPELLTSPKFSRKHDPQSSIKITQNEVEEKLKSMKLKRLSRLGTSATDQGQIFEDKQKVDERNEKATSTKIRFGEDRTKPSFKDVAEELLGARADQGLKSEPRKVEAITSENDKITPRNISSSTKKFINKFNCVISPNDGNVEVDNDTYLKHADGIQKASISVDGETDAFHQYDQNIANHSPYSNVSQRKTMYFKENESALPDLVSTASTGASISNTKQLRSKADNEDTEPEEADIIKAPTSDVSNTNGEEISDERKEIILRTKLETRSNIFRNSSDLLKPLQSPPLSSRRTSREDRILKKLQRSCKSLDEILKYDSDVDLDEIDDMKTTLDEAASLLKEYQNKLNKLEEKVSPIVSVKHRLCGVKVQLNKVKDDVEKFNGLKRDLQYMQLCNRLSNFYLEVHNISNKFELAGAKKELLAEIDKCIKTLEAKASRNEIILFEILSDQVEIIGNKYLNIMNIS